ncbi:hypothetical protein BDV41DRAFT_414391 [Aspergillus transmontanensis]|uniref:Secreted protein n=1 Tax=Aspergillus transmontanensis TaxID=1034304 RepID=A0A5N6WCR9_9EURO|nr:hypothetical protein BDV41DRAFT_414391 [Aspergillus transmontanensis]
MSCGLCVLCAIYGTPTDAWHGCVLLQRICLLVLCARNDILCSHFSSRSNHIHTMTSSNHMSRAIRSALVHMPQEFTEAESFSSTSFNNGKV